MFESFLCERANSALGRVVTSEGIQSCDLQETRRKEARKQNNRGAEEAREGDEEGQRRAGKAGEVKSRRCPRLLHHQKVCYLLSAHG